MPQPPRDAESGDEDQEADGNETFFAGRVHEKWMNGQRDERGGYGELMARFENIVDATAICDDDVLSNECRNGICGIRRGSCAKPVIHVRSDVW